MSKTTNTLKAYLLKQLHGYDEAVVTPLATRISTLESSSGSGTVDDNVSDSDVAEIIASLQSE